MRALSGTCLFLGLILTTAARLTAQGGSPPPGVASLFALDLSGTPLDEFPGSVKALNGTMTVVDKNGRHMLRASSPSEFLLTLSQNLPPAFTVIVDLIPKACCNPDDFMMEGTPAMNRGVASVQLTWHPKHLSAVGGGGEMYQSDLPADLAASTPGNLTRLAMEFSGTTVKLYTNGRRMYTLDKQFARGRVLRVWLGGQDEGVNAVYLASFSVLNGAVASAVIAGTPGQAGGSGGGGVSANPPTNPQPETPTPPAAPPEQVSPVLVQPVTTGTTMPPAPAPATAVLVPGTSVTGTGKGMLTASACNPAQTASGRGPSALTTTTPITPVGATLTWPHVLGAVGYVVERGLKSSGQQTAISSTCVDPTAFSGVPAPADNMTTATITFKDRTGGIAQTTTYTYVVHAYTATGGSGWNSVQWTSPAVQSLGWYLPTVTGSTVKLKWDVRSLDQRTGTVLSEPKDFLVTSDYGFSQVVSRGSFSGCGCYLDVLSVPTGDHTFTITARWPPDVSRSLPLTVKVSP